MSLLDEYLQQREILENKLSFLFRLRYFSRNHKQIELLIEEIRDLNFAISEMRRCYGDKCGYRPRTIYTAFHFDNCSE